MPLKRKADDLHKLSIVAEMMDNYTKMENEAYHHVLLKKQKQLDEKDAKIKGLMALVNNLQDQTHMLRTYIAEQEADTVAYLAAEEDYTDTDSEIDAFMAELMDI